MGLGVNALGLSNVSQALTPEQCQVVALRLQGKRWSEIAAKLGVTPWTIWSWRTQHPEIDQAIAEEAQDYLASTKHGLASLLPLTTQALEMALTQAPEFKDRIAAAKVVLELFKSAPIASQSAMLQRAKELSDAELDAAIDATPPAADPR